MLAAATAAGLPLFIAYYRRAMARFLKVKELVASGRIGDVRLATATLYRPAGSHDADPAARGWRLDPTIAGGGYFADLASHMLDLLDFILGPIEDVTGYAANQAQLYEAEDIVTASFTFASGAQGVGSWCFGAYTPSDVTEIIGSKGKVSYETFGNRPITLTSADGSSEYTFTDPIHIQQPLIQSVVAELTGAGHCPSTGTSAARTSRVMDQLLHNK